MGGASHAGGFVMRIDARSTFGAVIMHHPKREHYDDIVMNPSQTWFGHAGPWGHVLGAQDRVIMRHHIREYFPDFAAIVKLEEFDGEQLGAAIERLRKLP